MSETIEQAATEVGNVTYRAVEGYKIYVDGKYHGMTTQDKGDVSGESVPQSFRGSLLELAIDKEKCIRTNEKNNNVAVFGTMTGLFTGGATLLGNEVYQSNSNWIRAAYGLGSLVCAALSYGGVRATIAVIRNKDPFTSGPTQRIEHLEHLKQDLNPSTE